MTGILALVGGAEFGPGNEAQDRLLAQGRGGRPAYVVCAAVRSNPGRAAATAARWFATLGVDMGELVVHSRADADNLATADAARNAGLVYIAGGDPGRTVRLLSGTAVWTAIADAWAGGASLAGSSAGAMALCRFTLIRDRWPDHTARRPIDALWLVPDGAVLPHFDTFGHRWIPSAQQALGPSTPLFGIDEKTAAVWHEGRWQAMGPGAVTVLVDGERHVARQGEPVEGMPHPRAELTPRL